MLRPEVIRRRLEKIEEYLAVLEHMQRYSREEFLADAERYGSAERFLQLAIEAITDIASHVIAEKELGTVESGADIARVFHAHGCVDPELEERWIRMIGFRNVLVHDYLDVDRTIVYDVLTHNLADLRELAHVLAAFL